MKWIIVKLEGINININFEKNDVVFPSMSQQNNSQNIFIFVKTVKILNMPFLLCFFCPFYGVILMFCVVFFSLIFFKYIFLNFTFWIVWKFYLVFFWWDSSSITTMSQIYYANLDGLEFSFFTCFHCQLIYFHYIFIHII